MRMTPRQLLRLALGRKNYERVLCGQLTLKTISRNLFSKKFESEVFVLNQFVRTGSLCFDIGAAYGRYTLILSRLAKSEGHVYSFEPGSLSRQVLMNLVGFHRLRNVTVVQKALWNRSGRLEFAIPVKGRDRVGLSLAHVKTPLDEGCLEEEVEAVTLDEFCREREIQRVDFIKCDVEGAEFSVLEGARDLLERGKPTVLCEVDGEYLTRFGSSPQQLHDLFRQMGYKAFRLMDRGRFVEVTLLRDPHNYFFIHPLSHAVPS